ncbi:hypothetical protein AB1Y20_017766 [Prymnesium parvum]|uniref:TRPM SLOG domain-containing protein n=1 Tax=Prymnesium parvum TaxID=97485 RepID=A0AB34JLG5_PRYPA
MGLLRRALATATALFLVLHYAARVASACADALATLVRHLPTADASPTAVRARAIAAFAISAAMWFPWLSALSSAARALAHVRINPFRRRTRPPHVKAVSTALVSLLSLIQLQRARLVDGILRRESLKVTALFIERLRRRENLVVRVQRFVRAMLLRQSDARARVICGGGRLRFAAAQAAQRGAWQAPAPWVRVLVEQTPARGRAAPAAADAAHAEAMKEASEVVGRWLVHDSRLGIPSVVISLVGGARPFSLKPTLKASFERGLVHAARSGRTWIMSGGTNCGIMALAGQALAEHKATLVGITAWGATLGREQLESASEAAQGEEPPVVEYTAHQRPSKPGAAAVEPNHSCFVFVDDATCGTKAWGREMESRLMIEKALCERYDVPLVLVVVEGGAETVNAILKYLEKGFPVLLLRHSGGAADLVADRLEEADRERLEHIRHRGESSPHHSVLEESDGFDKSPSTPTRLRVGSTEGRRLPKRMPSDNPEQHFAEKGASDDIGVFARPPPPLLSKATSGTGSEYDEASTPKPLKAFAFVTEAERVQPTVTRDGSQQDDGPGLRTSSPAMSYAEHMASLCSSHQAQYTHPSIDPANSELSPSTTAPGRYSAFSSPRSRGGAGGFCPPDRMKNDLTAGGRHPKRSSDSRSRFDRVKHVVDRIVELEMAHRAESEDLQESRQLVFSYDVEQALHSSDVEENFDEAMLKAITRTGAVPLRAKLCLALDWNNASIMRQVLSDARAQAAVMQELVHQLDPASIDARPNTPFELQLCRDLAHVLHHTVTELKDADFDEDLVSLLLEQPHMQLEYFPFTLLVLFDDHPMGSNTRDWVQNLKGYLPLASWNLDSEEYIHRPCLGTGSRPGVLELLLWAVLAGRDRLAKVLWQHTEEPIRYALLVSQLYAHMATKEKTQSGQREKLIRSAEFEEWSVAMLTSCREDVAIALLEDDFEGRWPSRLLELAISGGSKRFIAHEYCEELLDRRQRWRGDTLDSDAVMPQSATAYHAYICVFDYLLRDIEARLHSRIQSHRTETEISIATPSIQKLRSHNHSRSYTRLKTRPLFQERNRLA